MKLSDIIHEYLENAKIEEDELESNTGHHTPEGLFTQSTDDIVDGLLKDANGDEELALKRINFYINRAGDGLSNKTAVHAAKRELEKKVEEKMEAKKQSEIFNRMNEYYLEAYNTMFEDDEEKKEKALPYWASVDFLLDNNINPYWQIAVPRKKLYFEPYDQIMSLDKVYPDGTLGMLTWKNGMVDDNTTRITPEEFKNALEDERNDKVTLDFDKHYYDTSTIGEIIASGDELYKAWIERFFNEHKDELELKNPYDRKTRKEFDKFWSELSNYDKSKYATGVSDIYGLATKDPRRGMSVGKIRFKKSPAHLNGKTTQGKMEIPTLDDYDKDPNKYPFSREFVQQANEPDKYRIDYLPSNSAGGTNKTFDRMIRKQNPDGTLTVVSEPEYDQYKQDLKNKMYKPATDDQMRSKMSDHDKIEYWLGKNDIDPKYASQPVKDSSGATWKITKAIETHNDISPVRFQLAFVGSPDFQMIKRPDEVKDMIDTYTEKEESIEEAFGRFGSKMAMPTVTDYNALYNFLEKMGIDPKFCRGAKLYGDLGQEWRITGYNLSDPENPLIAIQSYEKPIDGVNSTSKVMSNKVPLSTIQKWAQKQKNIDSQPDWDAIALDPFQSQKAKPHTPDPDRKPMKIKNFDKVAARAKHGVM